MGALSQVKNIGKEIERQLEQVGVTTFAQLQELGSKTAWLKIRAIDPSACYNRLCGLEGAIRGIRWFDLPQEVKDDLKSFYQAHR